MYLVGDEIFDRLPCTDNEYAHIITPIPWRVLDMASGQDNEVFDMCANFNYRQTRTRNVIERAFGKLKMQWQCLRNTVNWRVEMRDLLHMFCIIMHNATFEHGDSEALREMLGGARDDVYQPPADQPEVSLASEPIGADDEDISEYLTWLQKDYIEPLMQYNNDGHQWNA